MLFQRHHNELTKILFYLANWNTEEYSLEYFFFFLQQFKPWVCYNNLTKLCYVNQPAEPKQK